MNPKRLVVFALAGVMSAKGIRPCRQSSCLCFPPAPEYRIAADSPAGRRCLEEALEARRTAEAGAEYQPIRRGWFFGNPKLKEELLAQVHTQAGRWHYGEELRESAI